MPTIPTLARPHIPVKFRHSALLPIQLGLGFVALRLRLWITERWLISAGFYQLYPERHPKRANYDHELANRFLSLDERFSTTTVASFRRYYLDAIDLALLMFAVRLSGHACCSWPKDPDPEVKSRSRSLLLSLERHRRRALRKFNKCSGTKAYPDFRRRWLSFVRWMRAYLLSRPVSHPRSGMQREYRRVVTSALEFATDIVREQALDVSDSDLRKLVKTFLRSVRREREGTTIGGILQRRANAKWCFKIFLLDRLEKRSE